MGGLTPRDGYGLAKGIRAALAEGWRPARRGFLMPALAPGEPNCACALGLAYVGALRLRWGDLDVLCWAEDVLGVWTARGLIHGFDGYPRLRPPRLDAADYDRGYRAGARLARVLIEGRPPFGGAS